VSLMVGRCWPACSDSPDAEPLPRVLECEKKAASERRVCGIDIGVLSP
jgi:hypothetical protein